ncbi:hypothetical protein TVAG_420210 [Trichomonas vaginalis G3]|uniref:Uncharacterized protein n=1 Tax=Trichomonas vaginalis (strain ATCC PRA-98 / G3) TaxID=412133 RepID=A2ED44_TRIV3|nr:hypothetical protein TVAGG3_0424820 [Trichomonas vaginalis G3]EAY09399.1 hypothetical protein TVAG_420210 [Trichomonas vaginalis G3]KAI5536318.1 hypothetical protein TVAGG3_0424820 [Trichomonas vaginalis G3]|eukprot:XP_001321622.1 hypothetical protein [Trichomonas vaginalis G3]
MQQEFDLLSAAAKSGNNSDCSKYFKEFCAAFLKDLCNEIPASLFSKLIKKKTAFTAGLDYFNIIITSDIMSKIQLIDFHQGISSLFKLLMHYRMKKEIHFQSFDLFLTILDYFENTNDTVKLKLLGDLMVYGMDMSQFIENPESLYNCYIPDTKIEPEYNPKQFVKLYEKFLKHFKQHQSAFTYWWTIICESFLPVIFNSTSSQIKLIKNPKYNLNLFASALLDPSIDASKMSKLYPEYILLVISETAENTAISFFEKYSDYLSNIVISAADRFCSSILHFLTLQSQF